MMFHEMTFVCSWHIMALRSLSKSLSIFKFKLLPCLYFTLFEKLLVIFRCDCDVCRSQPGSQLGLAKQLQLAHVGPSIITH